MKINHNDTKVDITSKLPSYRDITSLFTNGDYDDLYNTAIRLRTVINEFEEKVLNPVRRAVGACKVATEILDNGKSDLYAEVANEEEAKTWNALSRAEQVSHTIALLLTRMTEVTHGVISYDDSYNDITYITKE